MREKARDSFSSKRMKNIVGGDITTNSIRRATVEKGGIPLRAFQGLNGKVMDLLSVGQKDILMGAKKVIKGSCTAFLDAWTNEIGKPFSHRMQAIRGLIKR